MFRVRFKLSSTALPSRDSHHYSFHPVLWGLPKKSGQVIHGLTTSVSIGI